jgi:death-on-curing protein
MRFLTLNEVIDINRLTTQKHGGLHGIREVSLLESAIANPQNLHHYQNSDIYTLASNYAISIIKNHPFLDGNKRTGFLAMDLFLRISGKVVKFPHKEAVEIMVKVATSEVSLEKLSEWLKNL